MIGPERDSDKWREQVERISTLLRASKDKKELEAASVWYILDLEYSRSAITQAMHDVEVEKGWHT